MKCPHCSKEIADDSKFCGFCGKSIGKRGNASLLWIVLASLIVIGLLGGVVYYQYWSIQQLESELQQLEQKAPDSDGKEVEQGNEDKKVVKEETRKDSATQVKEEPVGGPIVDSIRHSIKEKKTSTKTKNRQHKGDIAPSLDRKYGKSPVNY